MISLLVVDLNYSNTGNANSAILHRLFSGQDDIDVTVLTENINSLAEETVDGFHIIRKKIHSRRSNSAFSLHDAGVYPRLLRAKRYMKEVQDDVDYKRVEDFLYHAERLVDIPSFDVILSCSFPFESHVCAGRLAEKYGKKWIAYYLDPFATNPLFPDAHMTARIRTEEEVLRKCDAVLLTYPAMDVYQQNGVAIDVEKTVQVYLPGIRPIIRKDVNLWQDNVKNRSVFVGNLYWDIRDPMHVIECYRELGEAYHIYFIGGVGGEDREAILLEKGISGIPNVHFIEPVSRELAEQYLLQADVLVNIGNLLDNLIPSKVLDYLSSGKPVLNFYKREDCTSTAFFRSYPNAASFDDRNIPYAGVKNFLEHAQHMRTLDYDEIRRLYPDYSVSNVREIIMKTIRGVLND
ncbi:MAG: hypothetical protein IJI33_03355 [Solobacterium sp.]|nr:hypothetical protein [Solobacterium sp.]